MKKNQIYFFYIVTLDVFAWFYQNTSHPNIFVRKGLNIMKININQYRLRKRPKLAIQRLWSFLATNLNSVVESNSESTKSSTYLFKAIKKPQLCTIYLQNIHFYAVQPTVFCYLLS